METHPPSRHPDSGRPFRLMRLARRVPFLPVAAVVIALHAIGEFYPFSPFPMYSNISEEAVVLYVSDERGEPLPMHRLLTTGASQAKKIYKDRLKQIQRAGGTMRAPDTAAERREAALYTLDYLFKRRKTGFKRPEPVRAVQLQKITLVMRDGRIEREQETLAEKPLSP